MAQSIRAEEIFRNMELERLHPLGVVPPQALKKAAENAAAPLAEDDLCDFYLDGLCLNWEARPSECSSYFCDERITIAGEKHKISTFQKYSQENFEFEFLLAQKALKHMGHSVAKIGGWADDWNAWALSRQTFKNSWSLTREGRLQFYRSQWEWVRSIDLSVKRCQVPDGTRSSALMPQREQDLVPGTL